MLLPEQVSKHWATISHAIEVSAPPTFHSTNARMNNILKAHLEGQMQAWLACEEVGDKDIRVLGIVVTTVTEDVCSGEKSLLIYAIYSCVQKQIEAPIWVDAVCTLRKFAKHMDCQGIIAFTDSKHVVDMVTRVLGGNARFILITIPLEDTENAKNL